MPASRPLKERFEEKWIGEPNTGCWLWTASVDSQGYGEIREGVPSKRTLIAHRLSYELYVGEIPEGLTIDHLCRVRTCVNPAHLEPVTHKENVLRGVGFAAVQARKTHCPKGHAYSGDNLYVDPRGSRHCRECSRERMHDFRARMKDKVT